MWRTGRDSRVARRLLRAVGGLTDDIGHLRPSIGRWKHELDKIGTQGDGFAKTYRRATADRDDAVDAVLPRERDGRFGDIHRSVHPRHRKRYVTALTENSGNLLSGCSLFGR